jgi:hypothetical protein
MKNILMLIAGLALAGQAFGQAYILSPDTYQVSTILASSTMTGQTSNSAVANVVIDARQAKALAFAVTFSGTNTGTADIGFVIENSLDKSNWVLAPIGSAGYVSVAAKGIKPSGVITNIPFSYPPVGYYRMKYLTNANAFTTPLTNLVVKYMTR